MKNLKWILLVVIVYLLINGSGLFVPIVINAAKYAQVGREILDNNDWVHLTIGGDPYDQKPPLLFWIAALVFRLTGLSVINYKAFVLLISLAGVYGTFRLGALLYGRKTGLLAAFFWATGLGYVHFHNDIHTDTLLAVPVILSVWQYAAFYRDKKSYRFYLAAVFVGLGMLTKGPVAMVIIGSAVAAHLLFTRNFREILSYRWLLAAPVVLVLILPVLWGLYGQFGIEGIKFYFWTNNMGRVTGSYAGHNHDPFFYLHTTLYVFAPWAIFGLTGIVLQLREKFRRKSGTGDTGEFYTLGGIIVFLLISSVAKAKNPHYEVAIIPLMAVIAARWAYIIWENAGYERLKKIVGTVHIFTGILMIALAAAFLTFVFPENRIPVLGTVVLLAGASVYVLFRRTGLRKQIAYLFFSSSVLLFTLNSSVLPAMSTYQSSFEACRIFNEKASSGEKLHIYTPEGRYWEIFLYSGNYGKYIVTPDDYKRIAPPAGDWLYTGPQGLNELAQMKIKLDTVAVLQHKSMSSLGIKFLNPKTRASKLQPRYLLKIRDE